MQVAGIRRKVFKDPLITQLALDANKGLDNLASAVTTIDAQIAAINTVITSLGTVTSVSVVSAHGVSAIVATPTTTPALTFTLGAITPTSVVASGAISGTNVDSAGNVTGNSASATKLQTARTINGVSFDGTTNISISTAPSSLPLGIPITGTGAAANGLLFSSSSTQLGEEAAGLYWDATAKNLIVVAASGVGTFASSGFASVGSISGTRSPVFALYNGASQAAAFGLAAYNGSFSSISAAGDAVLRSQVGDLRYVTTFGFSHKWSGGASGADALTMTLGSAGNLSVVGTLSSTGALSASNFSGASSGTNTGDQIIALTGDVTGTGTGSFAATVAAHAITRGKQSQGGALTVIGVAGNATADVADIAATAASNGVLRESGSTIGFGGIVAAAITSGVIATAQLGTGSATGSTFLCGNGAWAIPPGSSGGGGIQPAGIVQYFASRFTSRATPAGHGNTMNGSYSPTLGIISVPCDSGTWAWSVDGGVTWSVTTTLSGNWICTAWHPGLAIFASVAYGGTNQAASSTDGKNYTARTPSAASGWQGLCATTITNAFIAVTPSGTGTARAMSSTNGTTWTARAMPNANNYNCVAWSSDLTIASAVASTGTGNRCAWTTDGATWNAGTSGEDNTWTAVCYGSFAKLFVAVSSDGTHRSMWSSDGKTYTAATLSAHTWTCVCASEELGCFLATSDDGFVAFSLDGKTWTTYPLALTPANGTIVTRGLVWVAPYARFISSMYNNGNNQIYSTV